MKLPMISFQHLIKEEVQKLHEVKPFVDPKLKSKHNDRIQYVATNDHRYPSEIVFIDTQKGEVVFFNIQQKEVERVSWHKLNSTHWVRPYLEKEFEGFLDGHSPSGKIQYEPRGFSRDVPSPGDGSNKYGRTWEGNNPGRDLKTGNKINIARAKAHFKQGEKIAVIHKATKNAMPIEDIKLFDTFTKFRDKYEFAYIVEGKLNEAQAMNMDTVPYNTIMKMKPGSTIKMKDGKIRTKDKFGNWRANTDPNDIIVNRDVVKHMKGMKGYNMGGGRIQIESKLNEGKYDHMIGKSFKLPGRGNASMRINRIEDDRFVHASPYEEWAKYGEDKASSSMYDIRKVIQHNPEIDTKRVKKRTAWNKGTGDPHLITKTEYAKILMGAMKDMKSMGDEEHTHDVAQSMIYDRGILARLVKDHPSKNSKQLAQQLQWDLEAAA